MCCLFFCPLRCKLNPTGVISRLVKIVVFCTEVLLVRITVCHTRKTGRTKLVRGLDIYRDDA